MAPTNRELMTRGFDLLQEGLYPFVDDALTAADGPSWDVMWSDAETRRTGKPNKFSKDDVATHLKALIFKWREFDGSLTRTQSNYASELLDYRNDWAHGQRFSSEDALRALDSMERLLRTIDAPDSANDVKTIRQNLQRSMFEEQERYEARKAAQVDVSGVGLKPWREVAEPHYDVARGDFQAYEFAADLQSVATETGGGVEYSDPREFFTRTYLTGGLRDLLERALRRMSGDPNASPVINLQTNFGGGKTHSLLALYHLFGDARLADLPQEIQDLVSDAGIEDLQTLGVNRVAIVGTALQPGSPVRKDDGTEVRTIWGELAWQLGGRDAYEIVAEADRSGTNPGEALRTLLESYGPALILIDEWVAYARQLVGKDDLPAGTFDTQFTFAQNLTEAAQAIPGVMVVVSIPASDTGDSGTDIEVGGAHGQEALKRLQNVVRRVASQWRPADRDESFEIVRRRLFKTPDAQSRRVIGGVARSFTTMYQKDKSAFPSEASAPSREYEDRIAAYYPLHPELLDRLYEDWSTLERFQRTRGVLKLVSSIVHELWRTGDTSPLIMPGTVPLAASTVNTDLTQYLEDQWKPIIDTDIDGPDCTAQRIDNTRSNLGARFVTQRLARTVFMGTAPRTNKSNKGLDKQFINLGTAIPGDALGNFGQAIDQMEQECTYFYGEHGRHWFDTQPSVTRTANDYAERLREDVETVWEEIVERLRVQQNKPKPFSRVYIAPGSSGDIPELEEVGLVIMHPRFRWGRNTTDNSSSYKWVQEAVNQKGASQRINRNTLVFLLADQSQADSLEAGVRYLLAWKMVQEQAEELNLTAQQQRTAQNKVDQLNRTVNDRLQDTYLWAVFPEQFDPAEPFILGSSKISVGADTYMPGRVGKKLSQEEQLVTELGPALLGLKLHGVLEPSWRKDGALSVGELWAYYTHYPYMERLANREVLDEAVHSALTAVLTSEERFALARGKNHDTGRYEGLILPPDPNAIMQVNNNTMLVEWDVAEAQHAEDQRVRAESGDARPGEGEKVFPPRRRPGSSEETGHEDSDRTGEEPPAPEEKLLTRYFGEVEVSTQRWAQHIAEIQNEVISQLDGADAEVTITIEIQAEKPRGFTKSERRTVDENAVTLKFTESGFTER